MEEIKKECTGCRTKFSLKDCKDRIVLEYRNKKAGKGLVREYFCSKDCFNKVIAKFLQ